jgi:signal transduction histidine kinase
MKYSILLILISLINSVGYGQDISVKEKVDKLNGNAMKFLLKPDSLIIYANQAYELAKTGNYKHGEGIGAKLKGIYEHRKSNFHSAIIYYKESLSIFTDLNVPIEIGKANLNIATSYNSLYDYVNSILYALKSLKIFEQLKDYNGKGRVLNLLGISSSAQKDYNEALKYFKEYNMLVKTTNDTVEIATSYNNIGSTYERLNKIDSAIFYHKLSSQLHRKKGNINGLGSNYQNIGNIYNDKKKDFKNALSFFQKSLSAYMENGNRKFMSQSYFNIGLAYKNLKDTINAINWLNKAIRLANEVGEKEILTQAYERLSEINAGDNEYKNAYINLRKSSLASDSILNVNRNKVIEELKAKYEVDKKNLVIKNHEIEITNQKLKIKQRNLGLGLAGGMLLLGILFTYLLINRRKLKAKADLQAEIIKQQDIASKAVLDAEERERRRIAGDLHDGVGQMLSAALMNLNGLFSRLNLQNEVNLQAEQALALVNESYDEMRSISHQMMPNALIKSGLASAVKEFIGKLDKDKLKVTLETVGLNERLDEQTETVIYRVIQETVNNVVKHAEASKLDIQIIKDEEGISVTIEDNGKGFDKNKVDVKAGIGLSNIYSRVEFLKGTVDIDSTEGKGTLVAIHLASPNLS